MASCKLLKLEDMNIIKIKTEEDLFNKDPALYNIREETFVEDWRNQIAKYAAFLKSTGCFVIYEPAYTLTNETEGDERFHTFMTISNSDQEGRSLRIKAYIEVMSRHEKEYFPGLEKGGYKTTPLQKITILQLESNLFIETAVAAYMLGYPVNLISIRDTTETKTISPSTIFKNGKFTKTVWSSLDMLTFVDKRIYPNVMMKLRKNK